MENLKIMTGTIGISLLMFLSISNMVYGQDLNSLQTAFTQSYALENEGKYPQAIEKLKKVYSEDSYEVNLRLGWLTYMAGMFTESIAFYNKAIELKPLSIEARWGYAYPASAMGNWNAVINRYNEILEIDPGNSVTLYRLGSIYYGQELYEKALSYLEKVANHYPFDYDIIILYAWTHYRLGKLREAKVLFHKALLIQPGDESALEGLGLLE